ncbi:hypothetical protein EV426DRAFT_592825 [Tirmania nivea]|nr:hypothetical protein EV426DRAFT_592825 [Tirmania nivea]
MPFFSRSDSKTDLQVPIGPVPTAASVSPVVPATSPTSPISEVQQSRFSLRRIFSRSLPSSTPATSQPDHDDKTIAAPPDPTTLVDNNITRGKHKNLSLTATNTGHVSPMAVGLQTNAQVEFAGTIAEVTTTGPGLADNPRARTGPDCSALETAVFTPLPTVTQSSINAADRSNDIQVHVQPLQRRSTIPNQLEENRIIATSRKLWVTAFKNLNDSERETLNTHIIETLQIPSGNTLTLTIEGLIQLVAKRKMEIDNKRGGIWTFTWKSKKFNMVKVLDNIISWADRFKAIGDTIVQYDPGHMALPWAAARFLLQIVTEDSANMAAITLTIERTTNVSTICAIYTGMYLDSRILSTVCFNRLEATLIKLHGNILSVLARAVRYLKHKREVVRSIFHYDNFEDHLRMIDDILQELRDDVAIAERDITNLNREWQQDTFQRLKSLLYGLGGTLENLERSVEALENDLQEKKRNDLLTWISTCPYKRHHDDILGGQQIMQNTGQWLFETDDFLDWIKEPGSSIFWLNGNPGVGKSHLTYAAIELLQQSRNKVVSYFYCSRRDNDKTRSDPEAILRALLKGLLMESGIDPEIINLDSRYKQRTDKGELSLKETQIFILKLLKEPLCDGSILCIDGLDEVDRNNRFQFVALVSEIVTCTTTKVWIASRPEPDIQRGLTERIPEKAGKPGLVRDVAIAKRNKGEIRQYIEREVNARIESGELLDGDVDEKTKQIIIERMAEKGDGMYLWVHLQILSLCSLTHPDYVQQQLEKLPQGLSNTYRVIYDQIRTAASSTDRENAINVFKWLCATTPLKFSELSELVRHTNTAYKLSAPVMKDENYLRRICHNLVAIDDYQQQDPEVRLVHLSVREFLESEQDFGLGGLPHEMALKTCLDHLLTAPSSSSLMPYIVLNWARHYRLAIEAYDRPESGLRIPSQVSEIVTQTNQFLKRAHQKWLKKLSDMDEALSDDTDPLFTIARYNLHELCQDVFRSPTSFNVKPENRSSRKRRPLHLAVEGGHLKTVESFITIGSNIVDVNAQDQDGRTPLALAIVLRKYDLIKLLLVSSRSAIDLNKVDEIGGFPPLVRAAWLGDEQIVQMLIETINVRPDINTDYASAHTELNLNGCDNLGRTAFHWAITRQNTNIIQLLGEAGADVNACDGVSKMHPLTRWACLFFRAMESCIESCQEYHDTCGDDLQPSSSAIATIALREKELKIARQLCQLREIDPNVPDMQGFPPIGWLLIYFVPTLGGGGPVMGSGLERCRTLMLAVIKTLLSTSMFDINAPAVARGDSIPPLVEAVRFCSEDLVELFLNHDPPDPALRLNINAIAYHLYPQTALMAAVCSEQLNLVKLLLRSRFSVDLRIPNIDGRTALQIAMLKNNRDIVKVLLQAEGVTNESELELLMNGKWEQLRQAASVSHESILQVCNPVRYIDGFLQHRRIVDYKALYQQAKEPYDRVWNILQTALNAANDDTAHQQLLSLDVNIADPQGYTALSSIFKDHIDLSRLRPSDTRDLPLQDDLRQHEIKKRVLRVLLALPGIDGNVRDKSGGSILSNALTNPSTKGLELLQMLLDAKGVVDVNCGVEAGFSPLSLKGILNSIPEGLERWKLLVADERINLNVHAPSGVPVLAMYTQNPKEVVLIRALLQTGRVQPNLQNRATGRPALSEAVLYSNYPAVKMLLKYPGVDIDLPDHSLDTPLSIAARIGHAKIVKALLRMKPNLTWRNYRGMTPMEIAVEEGHIEVVELLNDALDGEFGLRDDAECDSMDSDSGGALDEEFGSRDDAECDPMEIDS